MDVLRGANDVSPCIMPKHSVCLKSYDIIRPFQGA
jgi:hypothetical protein